LPIRIQRQGNCAAGGMAGFGSGRQTGALNWSIFSTVWSPR